MPNLPAPYVSPWREFGQHLRAVAADVRLRTQALWRRNREGDLPRPGFWPDGLAALFWPMLLLLIVVAAVSGGIGLRLSRPSASQAPVLTSVAVAEDQDPAPMPLVDGTADRASDPQPEPSLSQQPLSNPKPRQESGTLVETLEDSAALLDQPPAAPSLLLAEVANPITNRLQLTLSLSLWSALSVEERDQNAMAWLRSASTFTTFFSTPCTPTLFRMPSQTASRTATHSHP